MQRVVLYNDASWYATIVINGYERELFEVSRQHNWPFFPLFPSLWWLAWQLVGNLVVAGLLVSNAIFFLALIVLYKLVRHATQDHNVASRTVFYTAAFPTSYFFSLPWTESLFLFVTVCSVYFGMRGSWLRAGILGGFASATRFNGVLLLPTLAIFLWQSRRTIRRPDVLCLLCVPLGLIFFALYLYLITGNPLAFSGAQAAWGRIMQPPFWPLVDYLSRPGAIAEPWNFRLLGALVAVLALACGAALAFWRNWALSFYVFASAITALSGIGLAAHPRYMMVVFPIAMVLAVAGRRPWVDQVIRAVFVAGLGLLSGLFAANITFAGL